MSVNEKKNWFKLRFKILYTSKKIKFEEICSKFEVLAGQLMHHKPQKDMTKKSQNAKLVAAALEYRKKINL